MTVAEFHCPDQKLQSSWASAVVPIQESSGFPYKHSKLLENGPYSKMAGNGFILWFACLLVLLASFSLQNSFVFIHVDEAKGLIDMQTKNHLLAAILE